MITCKLYFADHSDIELSVEIFGLFIHFCYFIHPLLVV